MRQDSLLLVEIPRWASSDFSTSRLFPESSVMGPTQHQTTLTNIFKVMDINEPVPKPINLIKNIVDRVISQSS